MGRDGGGFAQYPLHPVLSCKVERAKHMFGKLGTQRLMCRNIGLGGGENLGLMSAAMAPPGGRGSSVRYKGGGRMPSSSSSLACISHISDRREEENHYLMCIFSLETWGFPPPLLRMRWEKFGIPGTNLL